MKIEITLGFILLFCISCEKVEIDAIDNLHNGKVYVIGHAGEGFSSHINHYPFNSAGSISRALKFHRADGIEVDFQMTKDYKGILYHDDYLDTKSICSGSVFEHSKSQLLNCRYSSGIYSSLFKNEYLIDLQEAFSICLEMPDPKPIVFIDIKPNPTHLPVNREAFMDSLSQLLSGSLQNYIPEKVHFISSDPGLLIKIKNKAASSYFHIEGGKARDLIRIALEYNFDGIVLTEDDIEAEDSHYAHDKGLYVTLFGVRNLDDIEDALEVHADFIHTNNIPLTQSVLRSL